MIFAQPFSCLPYDHRTTAKTKRFRLVQTETREDPVAARLPPLQAGQRNSSVCNPNTPNAVWDFFFYFLTRNTGEHLTKYCGRTDLFFFVSINRIPETKTGVWKKEKRSWIKVLSFSVMMRIQHVVASPQQFLEPLQWRTLMRNPAVQKQNNNNNNKNNQEFLEQGGSTNSWLFFPDLRPD